MKSKCSIKLGGAAASVFLAAILIALCSISEMTSAQPAQPCCADRWDPARTERGRWGPGRMGEGQRQRMARHWAFMHEGVPAEYRGQTNPFESSEDAVGEGRHQLPLASAHTGVFEVQVVVPLVAGEPEDVAGGRGVLWRAVDRPVVVGLRGPVGCL